MNNIIEYYKNNVRYNFPIVFGIICSFFIGLIFAPWSKGIIYLILFIIVCEIIFAIQIKVKYSAYLTFLRLGFLCVSIFSWIIGRMMVGDLNPLK